MTSPPPGAPSYPVTSAPPRSPGAVVPFAAPPRDKDNSKLIVGIIIAVVVAVVACGGGVVGLIAILARTGQELIASAQTAAADFLGELAEDDYAAAYDSACTQLRQDMTVADFTDEWQPVDVSEYQVGEPADTMDGTMVPAEVVSGSGVRTEYTLTVTLDEQTMKMAVCGWRSD